MKEARKNRDDSIWKKIKKKAALLAETTSLMTDFTALEMENDEEKKKE